MANEKLFRNLIDKGRLSGSGPHAGRYDALVAFIHKQTEDETELYIELLVAKRIYYTEAVYYYVLALLFTYVVDSKYEYLSLIIEDKINTGEFYFQPKVDDAVLFDDYIRLYSQLIESISPLQYFRFALFKKYKIKKQTEYLVSENSVLKEGMKNGLLKPTLECQRDFISATKNYGLINEFIKSFQVWINYINELSDFKEKNETIRKEHKNEMLFHFYVTLNENKFDKVLLFLRNQMRLVLLALIWENSSNGFKRKGFSHKEIFVLCSPMDVQKDGYFGDYVSEFLIPLTSSTIKHFDLIREYLIIYIFAQSTGVRLVGFLESQDIHNAKRSKTQDQLKGIKFPDPYGKELPLDYPLWGTAQYRGKVYYYQSGVVYIKFEKLSDFSLFAQSVYLGAYKTFWDGSQFYTKLYLQTEHLLTLMPLCATLFSLIATACIAALIAGPVAGASAAARAVGEQIAQDYLTEKLEQIGITGAAFLLIIPDLVQLLHGRIKARSEVALEGVHTAPTAIGAVEKEAAKVESKAGEEANRLTDETALDAKAAPPEKPNGVVDRGTGNPGTTQTGTTPNLAMAVPPHAPVPHVKPTAGPPPSFIVEAVSVDRNAGVLVLRTGGGLQAFTAAELKSFYLKYARESVTRDLTRAEEQLMMYGYIYRNTGITDVRVFDQVIAGGTGWKIRTVKEGTYLYAFGETGKTEIRWGAFAENDLQWYEMGNQLDIMGWYVKPKKNTALVTLSVYEIEIKVNQNLPMSRFAPQPNVPQPPDIAPGIPGPQKFQYYYGAGWPVKQNAYFSVTELGPIATVDMNGQITLSKVQPVIPVHP